MLYLTGYGADTAGNGTPTGDMLNSDGKQGYGFRLRAQGRDYGPYGGAETFEKGQVGGYPVFVDAWGAPIGYGYPTPNGYTSIAVPVGPTLIWSAPPAGAALMAPDPVSHNLTAQLITNVTN
jgi:hypothetical protein